MEGGFIVLFLASDTAAIILNAKHVLGVLRNMENFQPWYISDSENFF
jgi:hypothetical protein